MGICVEKLPHDCGTSDALQVYQEEDGSYTGFCFACNTYVKDPYNGDEPPRKALKIKTPEEIQQEINEIKELEAHDLPERKLTKRVLDFYGVKVSLSEYDGCTPVASWYPYYKNEELKSFKCKTSQKNIFTKGDQKHCDPFGWNVAVRGDRYKLFITEGEDDTLALFRAMMKHGNWKKHPAVISLSNGAGHAAECIERRRNDIQRMFKEVVLVFDQDDAGRKAVSDVAKLMPGVKVTQLPLKDANDMLLAGRSEELYRAAMWESTSKISGQSYRSSEIWHLAEETPEMGLPWPWDSLTDLTRGRRRGEVIYFGSGVKMGLQ
jgi:5S rRNA maturation endonuclease (ribonuclease M5)